MGHYRANLRDLEFVLFEVLERQRVLGTGPYEDVDPDTARDMLREVARLAEHELAESLLESDRTPPVFDPETSEQVKELMAKGAAGTVFLTTDDCRASYDELRGRGVEFTQAPEERPYGIDAGFRDPSGNAFRLTQVLELSRV